MKKSLFLPFLLLGSPAFAQEQQSDVSADNVDDRQITVVATGRLTRIDRNGQAVTVLGTEELESAQGVDVTRVLERVPGLVFSRNGGPGGFTSVRLRGSDAEQVLVLFDGVRVEDVSAPSGGFDFATLSPGEIERIDILRGSNSVPWGSAAMGGVIAVTSKALSGVEGSVEYGSNDTLVASGAAGLASDAGNITLSGGYSRSDGVSAAASGTEPDGYRNWRVGGRGRLALAPGLELVASGRYADTRTDIDGYAPPTYTFGDTPEYQTTRQASGYSGLDYAAGALAVTTGVAISSTKRDYFDPTFSSDPSYGYDGRSVRWNLNGQVMLPADFTLDFGADREWTRFSSTFDAEAKTGNTSGHVMLTREWDSGAVSAGVRRDEHDDFGGEWTFGANGSWNVADNLRLRASYGEGFKAPTLFQLLSDYGNADLQPETSRNFDIGLDFGGSKDPVAFSATLFRRDSRNLISYVSCASLDRCDDRPFGLYDNTAKARAQGAEVQLSLRPVDALQLQAIYSFTDSENRTEGSLQNGNELARRPRHVATFVADWTVSEGGPTLGADLRWVGDSFDDAGNFTPLDSYALVALRASLPVSEQVELYGRVENLFDTDYETSAGYGTWGRSAFVGVRARY